MQAQQQEHEAAMKAKGLQGFVSLVFKAVQHTYGTGSVSGAYTVYVMSTWIIPYLKTLWT